MTEPGAQQVGASVRIRPVRTSDVDLLLSWRSEPTSRLHQPLRDFTREELSADLRYLAGSRLASRDRDR